MDLCKTIIVSRLIFPFRLDCAITGKIIYTIVVSSRPELRLLIPLRGAAKLYSAAVPEFFMTAPAPVLLATFCFTTG